VDVQKEICYHRYWPLPLWHYGLSSDVPYSIGHIWGDSSPCLNGYQVSLQVPEKALVLVSMLGSSQLLKESSKLWCAWETQINSGDLWCSMVIYGDLWWFMVIYGDLWWSSSGWWLSLLLWKMMEFVSWNDEIPIYIYIWKVIQFHGSQPPPRICSSNWLPNWGIWIAWIASSLLIAPSQSPLRHLSGAYPTVVPPPGIFLGCNPMKTIDNPSYNPYKP